MLLSRRLGKRRTAAEANKPEPSAPGDKRKNDCEGDGAKIYGDEEPAWLAA